MAGALDGIRVIDFGQWLAGPLSALLLADQGAEVLHVDPPGGPRWKTAANATLQRGKKSLVLDLKTDADRAFARALIGSADVLIENFRPGVMDRLGLGWDAVRHDRLIYCSLPGFAADDPRAAGIVVAVDDPEYGRMLQPGPSVRLNGSPSIVPVPRTHIGPLSGKRTILIDLKRAEGVEILWRLVESADALLQNLRLGVAERLGFGYEQVRTRKPDMVYLSISAFGYSGEWQYRPGYEPNAQAITGMQARMRGSVDRPSGQPFAVNDYCTGLLGAFGLGLGLLHRLRRGEGQHVDTSLGHAATFLQLPYLQTYVGKAWNEPSGPQAKGWGTLHRLYRAADTWFILGAKEAQIKRLASIPGLQAVRGLAGAPLEAQLEACFRAKPAGEWMRLLVEAGMGAHTLGSVTQLMQDPWAVAHGLSVTRRHSDGSMITTTGSPVRLSRTPAVPGRPVSPPGGDAAEVLALIGMADKLDELVEKRMIALD